MASLTLIVRRRTFWAFPPFTRPRRRKPLSRTIFKKGLARSTIRNCPRNCATIRYCSEDVSDIGAWLAQGGEFELPVPISELPDDSSRSTKTAVQTPSTTRLPPAKRHRGSLTLLAVLAVLAPLALLACLPATSCKSSCLRDPSATSLRSSDRAQSIACPRYWRSASRIGCRSPCRARWRKSRCFRRRN